MTNGEFSNSGEKLTIAEAVDLLRKEGYDVSTHKLRQYEKQKLIFPEKGPNKYRLYSDSDLREIRTILALLTLDFSIKEIKRFFILWTEIGEIMEKFWDVGQKLEDSKKLELTVSDNKFTDWARKHHEIITEKWTKVETNKNILVLSQFLDFYNRILETMNERKTMLDILRKTLFKDATKDTAETILKIIKEETIKKPPL